MTSAAERRIGHGELLITASSLIEEEERVFDFTQRFQNGNNHGTSVRDDNRGFVPETRIIQESGEQVEEYVLVRKSQLHGIELALKEKWETNDPDKPMERTTLYGMDNTVPFSVAFSRYPIPGSEYPRDMISILYGQEVYEFNIANQPNPCPAAIQERIATNLKLRPRMSQWG